MARVKPLGAFGAEIQELDLREPLRAADADLLQRTFRDRHLLVFRNQKGLSDTQQVALAGLFGVVADEYLDGSRIAWVTNKAATKTTVPGEYELIWHSDYTFTRWPLQALSLHAIELSGKGTPTRFASAARAWAALPDDLKAALADRTALHLANFSGEAADLGLQADHFGDDPDPELYPHAWHPVMLRHPATGQPLLFVNQFLTVRIGGVSADESRALLARLWPALYDPAHIYEHEWREGDLLVWDNLALQHARGDFAPASGEAPPVRTLRRVSVSESYERMLDSVPRLKQGVLAQKGSM